MGVCATTSETETRVRAPTFWSSGTSNGRRSRRNNRRYSDKVDAKLLKQKVDELGIKVPGVLGAWGYYHAGENRDLVGSGDEVRRKSIEYAKKSLDQASVFGAKFFEVCAGQPGIPQLPWPVEPIDTLRQRFADAVVEDLRTRLGITVLLEPLTYTRAIPAF